MVTFVRADKLRLGDLIATQTRAERVVDLEPAPNPMPETPAAHEFGLTPFPAWIRIITDHRIWDPVPPDHAVGVWPPDDDDEEEDECDAAL